MNFKEYLKFRGYSESSIKFGRIVEEKILSSFEVVPDDVDKIIEGIKKIRPLPKSSEATTKSFIRHYLKWRKEYEHKND